MTKKKRRGAKAKKKNPKFWNLKNTTLNAKPYRPTMKFEYYTKPINSF